MKKAILGVLVGALSLGVLSVVAAADEGRVIEDELVLQDPTVAAQHHWVIGGSYEYWSVNGPYNTYDRNTGKKIASGSINGTMPGGNGFIGYDNLTVQYSHRGGTFNITQAYATGGIADNAQKQTEDEVTVRYVVKSSPHFNPYFIAGFNGTTLEENNVLRSGFVWAYNGKRTSITKTVYSSGLFGVGAITPFNQYIGLRGDGRLLFTSATYTRDDGKVLTGSGAGVGATGTLYINLFKGLNIQGGLKGQYLGAGENIASYSRVGVFGSVGYSLKF
jgi:hypothetical protein